MCRHGAAFGRRLQKIDAGPAPRKMLDQLKQSGQRACGDAGAGTRHQCSQPEARSAFLRKGGCNHVQLN